MVNGKPYRKRQWQDPDSYVWHTRVVLIGKWKACIPHTNLLQSLDWQSFFKQKEISRPRLGLQRSGGSFARELGHP
jgi:hypothetical protein